MRSRIDSPRLADHVTPTTGQSPVSLGGEDPIKPQRRSPNSAAELVGCAIAALAAIWLTFSIAGLSAPFGLFICWLAVFFSLYGTVSWRLYGALHAKDRLGTVAVWIGGVLALAALLLVIGYVVLKGGPVVFAAFPHFLTADFSGGGANNPVTSVGAGAAIVGTVEQVGIATVLSVPLAMMTATYLVESSSYFSRTVRGVIDAMTGTPSIIAGLFIFLIWVVPHKTSPVAKNGFVAAVALSIMMVPVVTRAALEVIRIVPGTLREAALALGAPQWRVAMRIVMPAARAGLVTATILGVARTAGETAEVLFTAGGNAHYNWNPFHGPQDDLPLRIFQQVFQPSTNAIREGWGVAFVLLIVVLVLFTLARTAGSSGRGRMRGLVTGVLRWRGSSPRPPVTSDGSTVAAPPTGHLPTFEIDSRPQ